jgi:hypothetical protein
MDEDMYVKRENNITVEEGTKPAYDFTKSLNKYSCCWPLATVAWHWA